MKLVNHGTPSHRCVWVVRSTSPCETRRYLHAVASMWSAQVDLSQSRVLIRLDLNVPLSKDDGVTITDDTRLRAVVPTMNFLKEQGASVVVAAAYRAAKGEPDPKFPSRPSLEGSRSC